MKWLLSALSATAASLLLTLPGRQTSAVTGEGPRSVHPINERFLAVADSSVDSVLIVDGNAGGAVVGHLVLHDRAADGDRARWLKPTSLATCDDCKHLYVTSNSMLYKIALERPLLTMARAYNFDAFGASAIEEFWPENWKAKFSGDKLLRAVTVARDGSSAYVAHAHAVFSFDPENPDTRDSTSRKVIRLEDAGINGQLINNIHHSHSLKNLILTSDQFTSFVSIKDDYDENPLDRDRVIAYQLPLNYHCNYLHEGADMRFFDTVILGEDYAFALGQVVESDETPYPGVAIYRLTWDEDDEQWYNCVEIAGSGVEEAQWVDGLGRDARFSATARQLSIVPTAEDFYLMALGDTDNRAVRLVDVTGPVLTDDKTDEVVGVSSVAYDEDLFQVLYRDESPWTELTPESVSRQDGKSYFHSGEESVFAMSYDQAQDECSRIGVGRVCTLPELRSRFARGQYPSLNGSDDSWTTVWTAQGCSSCHLQEPGSCPIGGTDGWGEEYKMIANFSPADGMQTMCVHQEKEWNAMSMCCGVGGPAVLASVSGSDGDDAPIVSSKSEQVKKAGTISAAVVVPLVAVLAAAGYAMYMRKRTKPAWWPEFMRNDSREKETGHAPHREVDLRGRDYI